MLTNKNKFSLILGILILFLTLNFINAEILVSDLGVKYDADILVAFNNSEWVGVIVDVNLNYSVYNVSSSISETHLKFIREMDFSNAFVANITRFGLEELINNTFVINISLDRNALEYLINGLSITYSSSIPPRFESGEESVRLLIGFADHSGIIINGTKEERDSLYKQREEWYINKVNKTLESLSGEIDLIHAFTSIQGYITKEGFDILLKNPDISSIQDMTDAPSTGIFNKENQSQSQIYNSTMGDKLNYKSKQKISFLISIFFIFIIFIIILIKIRRNKR